jgi:hypothetical protein
MKPKMATVLLSLADSQKRARNLVSWSTSQRAIVEARLLSLFANWCDDWDLSAPMSSAELTHLSDVDARRMLSDQLFGPIPMISRQAKADVGPSVAQSLADQAWEDWVSRLASAMGNPVQQVTSVVSDGPVGRDDSRPSEWDASLDIDFPWWNGRWSIRLDGASVTHLLGVAQAPKTPSVRPLASPDLVSVTTALAGWPLKVIAQFSPVSLTLGQIQLLRVGDVIPLSQRLDEPATLLLETTPSQTVPLCAAWLGQRQGRMATELLTLPN